MTRRETGNATRSDKVDFVIFGAMKSGTSSLHRTLDAHPDVFIPNVEVHYFDIDDIFQHPDFFVHTPGTWHIPRFGPPDSYRRWYDAFFEEAKAHQLVGEDSTTYLASAEAARRLAVASPSVRIIVMLRDPASRCYSQYWLNHPGFSGGPIN